MVYIAFYSYLICFEIVIEVKSKEENDNQRELLEINKTKEKESIQLVSTNPIYKPYFVHADEIIEVWKFVNYISSDIPEIKLDEENLKKTLIILQKEVT